MRVRKNDVYNEKKEQIMRACFECFAEKGLHGTGISAVAEYAGVSKATIYVYFSNLDQLITESTTYCMAKVEDEFMEKSPKNISEVEKFIDEIPYWTAKTHEKNIGLCIKFTLTQNILSLEKSFLKEWIKDITSMQKLLSLNLIFRVKL